MLIISNQHAGDKSGDVLVRETVIPLIQRLRPSLHLDYKQTQGPGDAGDIARAYVKQSTQQDSKTILISGGDTTIHEVVNGLVAHKLEGAVSLILVPSGTANALYHSLFPPTTRATFWASLPKELQDAVSGLPEPTREKLYSVLFYLSESPMRRLHSTRTTVADADGVSTRELTSCVVVSSSLHASILEIAEQLRAEHPGIERFKLAAAKSITQWSQSRLEIKYPFAAYNPATGTFITRDSSPEATPNQFESIDGPFAYFLTTTNVDRLEMEFRIAPLATSLPAGVHSDSEAWMELLMIRPLRDPSILKDAPWQEDAAIREQFAPKTVAVLQGAYQNGTHPNLSYTASGEVSNGSGESTVVEYLRVKEWKWTPDPNSPPAHLVCVDGEVLFIPIGGSVTVKLNTEDGQLKMNVAGGIESD